MEKIIVSLIVVAAIAFLIDRVTRSVKTGGCSSGGCSCANKNAQGKAR
jgi:hypothetical protein